MTTPKRHPTQPLEADADGFRRFKANSIVRYLLDSGPSDLNRIHAMDFSQEDREQFVQLIGYSYAGFGELDYVSPETYEAADVGTPTVKYMMYLEDLLHAANSQIGLARSALLKGDTQRAQKALDAYCEEHDRCEVRYLGVEQAAKLLESGILHPTPAFADEIEILTQRLMTTSIDEQQLRTGQ